jgi:hypothetical protein
MKFKAITPLQEECARSGICPNCQARTLEFKHASTELRFLQCGHCNDIVALGVQ